MHDVALMAATEWARAHVSRCGDPVSFGVKVAQVYGASQAAITHAGDERVMAAALAALSVPAETLQAIGLLSSLQARPEAGRSRAHLAGAPGADE